MGKTSLVLRLYKELLQLIKKKKYNRDDDLSINHSTLGTEVGDLTSSRPAWGLYNKILSQKAGGGGGDGE